jgi:hypothetical protein
VKKHKPKPHTLHTQEAQMDLENPTPSQVNIEKLLEGDFVKALTAFGVEAKYIEKFSIE